MKNNMTSTRALRILGVSRVDDLPTSKMGELFKLVAKMPEAERQSLFSGVKDFPRLIEKAMEGFKENAKYAFMGNAESMRHFYAACDHVVAVVHDMVRAAGSSQLSERDRMVIKDLLMDVLQMMKEKDTENKEFIEKTHEKGDRSFFKGILVGTLVLGGGYLVMKRLTTDEDM